MARMRVVSATNLNESRSLADGRCFVEVVQQVRKLVATSQKVSGKLGHPSMQRVDPTDSNACFRYLLITVCRSEQQANRSISHGERSERRRAPSNCFASFVGLLSRRIVCLSACDSQRRAHQHHAISSERRWISARVQCCGCNLPLRSCVMRSFCLAAGLLHRVVLAVLRGCSQPCDTHASGLSH